MFYRAESAFYSVTQHLTEGTRHRPKHSAVDALPLGLGSHLKWEFKITSVIIFKELGKPLFVLSFKWVYCQSYSLVVQQKTPNMTHDPWLKMVGRFSGEAGCVVLKIQIKKSKTGVSILYRRHCASAERTVQQAEDEHVGEQSGPELLTLVQHRVSMKQR